MSLAAFIVITIFTLAFFIYGLRPPSSFKAVRFPYLIGVGLSIPMLLFWVRQSGLSRSEEIIGNFALPFALAVLLIVTIGIGKLADQLPPWLGIPLSLATLLGCSGVSFILVLPWFLLSRGAGPALAIIAWLAGKTSGFTGLALTLFLWGRRVIRDIKKRG